MVFKNKINFLQIFLLGIIFLLFPIFSSALDVPTLTNFVTDNANLLTQDQKETLENSLKNFETQTTNQIVILTVNNLDGDTIENYSIEVAEKNKIGDKEKDNGVLLLISKEDRQVRIEVGMGLEESLTDAKSSYIIRHSITPEFKEEKYYEGINNGIQEIEKTISDQNYLNEEIKQDTVTQQNIENISIIFNILFPIILFIIFLSIFRKNNKQGKSNLLTWILFDQIFFHNNRGGKGGGFGSFGGFGGGGFHGGGGSFGGGGASGGW